MRPRYVFAGDDSDDTRQRSRLFGIDSLDFCVRLRTEKRFPMEHVRKDEIIAVNRFAGDFFLRIDALDRFTYN